VRARVEYVKPKGVVNIQFNKKMNFHDDIVNVLNYYSLTKEEREKFSGPDALSNRILNEPTTAQGQAPDEEDDDRVMVVEIMMGEYSQKSDLTFSWKVVSVDSRSIQIRIYANTPTDMSAFSSPERVRVHFRDKKMFTGSNGNELLTDVAERKIPTLISNEKLEEAWETTSAVVADGVKYTTLVTSGINVILSASLALLWSLINMLQLIVLLPLVNVQYPQNAFQFNKEFLTIANFDMLPMQDFY